MEKAIDTVRRFLAAQQPETIRSLAVQLTKLLYAHGLHCTEELGDQMLAKVKDAFNRRPVPISDLRVLRSLGYQVIAAYGYCTQKGVQQLFDYYAELFVSVETEQYLFAETIAGLTGVMYAKTKSHIDPRPGCACLGDVFAKMRLVFPVLGEEEQRQALFLLAALLKGYQGIIYQQWDLIYHEKSLVSLALEKAYLRESALSLLKLVSGDSNGVFKYAIKEPEVYYTQSLAIRQGMGISHIFAKLNALLAVGERTNDQLIATYEALLSAINWFNLGPPIKEFINMQEAGSFKGATMILKALKYEITSLYTFNKYKKGPYYADCLRRFYPMFLSTTKYLVEYYANMGQVWYNLRYDKSSQKNMFASLNSLAEKYTEDAIQQAVQFVGSYLAVYPAFPIIIDLRSWEPEVAEFLAEDGVNYIQRLVEQMGYSVKTQDIDPEQQIFNFHLLEAFIYHFYYGLNLSLGVLSKKPDEQTVNYYFQYYLIENDLRNLARPPTVYFVTRVLNEFYEQYVLASVQNMLLSVNYPSASYVFFNIIYHIPGAVLQQLDDDTLKQMQVVTLQACRDLNPAWQDYEQGRCLYALQNMSKMEMEACAQFSSFVQEVNQLLVEVLVRERFAANLKKPLLYIVGMLIPRGWVGSDVITLVFQLALKGGRSYSTALRVIGILFYYVQPDLDFSGYPKISLQQGAQICLDSAKSRGSVFLSGAVAIRELFMALRALGEFDYYKFMLLQHDIVSLLQGRLEDAVRQHKALSGGFCNRNQLNKLIVVLIQTIAAAPIGNEDVDRFVVSVVEDLLAQRHFKATHEVLARVVFENERLARISRSTELLAALAEHRDRLEQQKQVTEYMNYYLSADPEEWQK